MPIVRIVDPDLTMRMTEYVALHVLMHHRRQRRYDAQQRAAPLARARPAAGERGRGRRHGPRRARLRCRGGAAPARLPRRGLEPHAEDDSRASRAFTATDGLDAFLRRTEILVCLLPATPATAGILRLELLRKLRRDGAAGGAYLINAGRGALQVDADILAALDEGSLAGATLDVFATEPLPATSPLWTHPKVTVTPHNAAASDPRALAANVLRQIERFEAGLPLEHVIDRAVGY